MNNRNLKLTFLPALALLASSALAAPEKFTVLAADAQNVVIVESETAVENWTGRTTKVSGDLTFDRAARGGNGTIIIDGASITTGVPLRDEHMRSPDWMNFDRNPRVVFVVTSARHIEGDRYRVSGNLTINDITKPLTTEALVRYTAANEATKAVGAKGDVVAISTKFNVKLSDYGVKHPAINIGRVNDELALTVKFISSNR